MVMTVVSLLVKSRVAAMLPSVISPSFPPRLKRCSFRPAIKAGMSSRDAADAIDSAMRDYLNCLTSWK